MTAKRMLLAKAAALMGSKGGHAGRGRVKRRGNANYYREMQKKSVVARLGKKDARN